MGEALLSRLVARGIYRPDAVLVSDPLPQRRNFLQGKYGIRTTGDNCEAAGAAEVVLLAIKPQIFDTVAVQLQEAGALGRQTLVVSILAGVPLSRLEAALAGQPIVRAMPNTPATVGAGMTAIAPGTDATSEHLERAKTIFAAVGEVVEVPESLMDAVTGLSGSGPAFVAVLVEALADGGVKAGLPRAIAAQLAVQTVLGTAQLLRAEELHPAQLKDRVTSPGGTTIAGVVELERQGFRSAAISAVYAAYLRSQELGRSS